MPTPSIGQFPFLAWDGFLQDAQRRFEIIRRRNVPGVGIAFDDWEAGPADITTLNVYAASEVPPDLRGLAGQDVDVIEPTGQRTPCTVANVRQGKPLVMVDGSVVRVVTFTLVPATVAPETSVSGSAL